MKNALPSLSLPTFLVDWDDVNSNLCVYMAMQVYKPKVMAYISSYDNRHSYDDVMFGMKRKKHKKSELTGGK